MEFMVIYGDHRQSKYLQFWLHNCFVQPLNGRCQISSHFISKKSCDMQENSMLWRKDRLFFPF